jgi:hypothetical protein
MVPVRALLVLVTILSFATPQVSFASIQRASGNTVEISLSAPAVGTQLVRAAVKTDKTFGTGLFVAVDVQPLFAPSYGVGQPPTSTHELPNLDLGGPPLAPRPPPASA